MQNKEINIISADNLVFQSILDETQKYLYQKSIENARAPFLIATFCNKRLYQVDIWLIVIIATPSFNKITTHNYHEGKFDFSL